MMGFGAISPVIPTPIRATEITDGDFLTGSRRTISFARPGKLFTANRDLMVAQISELNDDAFHRIIDAIVNLLRGRT
jgi:mRNA interferase MazF